MRLGRSRRAAPRAVLAPLAEALARIRSTAVRGGQALRRPGLRSPRDDGRPRIPLHHDPEKAAIVACIALAAVGGLLASLMADGSGGLPADEPARPAAVTASALPPCDATPGGEAGVLTSLASDARDLTGPCADTGATPVRATPVRAASVRATPLPRRAQPRQRRSRASRARRRAARRRPAVARPPTAAATPVQRRRRPAARPARGATPPPRPVAPAPAVTPPPPPVTPPPAAAARPRRPVAPPPRAASPQPPARPAPSRPASPPRSAGTPFDDSG